MTVISRKVMTFIITFIAASAVTCADSLQLMTEDNCNCSLEKVRRFHKTEARGLPVYIYFDIPIYYELYYQRGHMLTKKYYKAPLN